MNLSKHAQSLRTELQALYWACRDARTPWYAKALAAAVVAYALSPLDLIPDFIPILGYLDDVILIPLGMALAIRLIPPAVLAECRSRASQTHPRLPASRVAAAFIILIWLALVGLCAWWLCGRFLIGI